MSVSGPHIRPGTTVVNPQTAATGSTTFTLSQPHLWQGDRSINVTLLFNPDEQWVLQQQRSAFATLFAQVSFLRSLFSSPSPPSPIQLLSTRPYPPPPSPSPSTLADVARTALVTCTSALVELAGSPEETDRAVELEEGIMQQLYLLLCDDFEEDTHRLLLDISCNAYARASGGGARVKLAVAEDVIVRALVAFNVLDVHYDQARAHRHASFIRCLSPPLLPPTPTLASESLILHCYTRACLAPHTLSFTPAPKMLAANPFGAPLPQWALQVAGVGGPCVAHSYAGEDDGM